MKGVREEELASPTSTKEPTSGAADGNPNQCQSTSPRLLKGIAVFVVVYDVIASKMVLKGLVVTSDPGLKLLGSVTSICLIRIFNCFNLLFYSFTVLSHGECLKECFIFASGNTTRGKSEHICGISELGDMSFIKV